MSPPSEEPARPTPLEGEARDDFATELLARLSSRAPTSGRYRLKGEVASGGMGAVLRVWDEDLRRHLAMKVMLESEAAASDDAVDAKKLARFLEEAQVTGQLDHPGIVPVHELGLDGEGRVYFTMKLVLGKTLKEVFDELARGEGGWSETRVLALLLRVCEATSYAHAKGVIHRDLKPANVMVGRFGEVYVMDWGLAKIQGSADARDIRLHEGPASSADLRTDRRERAALSTDFALFTMDGDVVGTPAYMPPEQAAGRIAEMGPHSDVYALGAILYHLLARQMPYGRSGVPATPHDVWTRVKAGPPRPLRELAPAAPAELVAIAEKAMARDPAARYRDMGELAADLSAFLEHRVVAAYETGAWAEARKWVGRNRPLAAALAAAVLLLAGGLVTSLVFKARADDNAALASLNAAKTAEQARIALANEDRAREQERIATRRADDVLSLSASKDLEDLVARAEALWPPHPELADGYELWLADARALIEGRAADPVRGLKHRPGLAEHEAKLAELRRQAIPPSPAEAEAERASHPRSAELARKKAELERRAFAGGSGAGASAPDAAELDALAAEVEELERAVSERRAYAFADPEAAWWHVQLSRLVADLRALRDPETGLMSAAVVPPFGWGVAKRSEFAHAVAERSVDGADARARWAEATAAIATSDRYGGLRLAPQIGLLPIGADPESGLWEFAHLMTGAPADRGPDGKLVLTEETGIVLVLLPGGTFWMGAQKDDPAGHNYDPGAQPDEGPVHEVELSPFFLAKHELTQGQWKRLTGTNPSYYQPPSRFAPSLLHPVETVSWFDFMRWLPREGLALPSEAQWEYGARGGTDTPWWTGVDRESLRGKANLADQAAARGGGQWQDIADWPDLDDGYVAHAPVGTFPANGFGLHEVAGNLWEWCLDASGDIAAYSPGFQVDPVAPWEGADARILRGGGFIYAARTLRSADRGSNAPFGAGGLLGARPARAVTR